MFLDGTESSLSNLLTSPPIDAVSTTDPTSPISAAPLNGTAPLTVSFNAGSSTGSITSSHWNFGDGTTDIPCMRMVKQNGGHSIAVYKPGDRRKKRGAEQLILDGRVNFVCKADYSEGGEIDSVVRTIIDKIKSDYEFEQLLKKHRESAERLHVKAASRP